MARIDIKDLNSELKKQFESKLKKSKGKFFQKAKTLVKKEIISSMNRGVSPVKGEGRYKQYSESYKKQIKGELSFFTKNGKVIPIRHKKGVVKKQRKSTKSPKTKKQPKFNSKSKTSKTIINKPGGKKIRPVNLKVSGGLHRSLKTMPISGGLKIWFTSKLAKYHNKLGAGKSKVKRKMLPDDGGEFSRVITKKLVKLLADIMNKK